MRTKVSKHLCPNFPGYFPDFQRFCPDFRQIKTFAPPHTAVNTNSVKENDLHKMTYISSRRLLDNLTLRIRVKTLINETNIKDEATSRYQFEVLLFSWKSHTKHVGELHASRVAQFARTIGMYRFLKVLCNLYGCLKV